VVRLSTTLLSREFRKNGWRIPARVPGLRDGPAIWMQNACPSASVRRVFRSNECCVGIHIPSGVMKRLYLQSAVADWRYTVFSRVARRWRRPSSGSIRLRSRRPILEALETRQLLSSAAHSAHVHLNLKVAAAHQHAREAARSRDSLANGTHLYISSTIATTTAGASLGTITVQELSGQGKVATGDNSTIIQLSIEANPGGAQFLAASNDAPIGSTVTMQVHNGVASFSNLALNKAGIGYTLAAAPTNNPGLLPATSNQFVITAGKPAGLAFLV
jgi:hypothetical protein